MGGVEAKRPMAMSGWSMTVLGGVSLEVPVRKSSRIMPLKQLVLLFKASSLVEWSWRLVRLMSFHTSSMGLEDEFLQRRR